MNAPEASLQRTAGALSPDAVVGVIGAGTMGAGIAQVAAVAGHHVHLYDVNASQVARGRSLVEKDLLALVERGKLTAAASNATLSRIVAADTLGAMRACDLVIEAAVEDLGIKQQLFADLEAIVGPDCVLATNTSSLSVTAIAGKLKRPERVVGMHFFNPPPRMKLVEIVRGVASADAVVQRATATARAWGKLTVPAKSTPGFIVNRLARPFYAEAWRVLREQPAQDAATCASLDALVREAGGFPMGPFELMDLIGHDVNLAVTQSVFEASFFDRRYMPALEQQELVRACRLGRKSGQGLYAYGANAAKPSPQVVTSRVRPAPEATVVGDLGVAAPLVERLAAAGIRILHKAGLEAGQVQIGSAQLLLTDGRTATEVAAAHGHADTVLFDLAADFATTQRIGLTRAASCSGAAFDLAGATLSAAGLACTPLADVPGLIVMRTVTMLVNEACDAVAYGICGEDAADQATRHGLNYARGPMAWGAHLGLPRVAQVLHHLQAHYGEERYRTSVLIKRRLAAQSFAMTSGVDR
ncbi:MAG: 3-hydroxyacyl-CoA dehydrogenase [Betaproteobacteria bacterium]